jgi:hypothetical protein
MNESYGFFLDKLDDSTARVRCVAAFMFSKIADNASFIVLSSPENLNLFYHKIKSHLQGDLEEIN